MSLLSCLPDFHREGLTAQPSEVTTDNDEYVFTYNNEGSLVKYWIDPDRSVIVKRCTFNGKNKLLREEKYENYYKINDYSLPRSIKIILHQEKQSLSLFYENIEVNTRNLDFSFSLPEDIKVVHWREEG
jgi:hypothetical protein